jgi:hypothetical protein
LDNPALESFSPLRYSPQQPIEEAGTVFVAAAPSGYFMLGAPRRSNRLRCISKRHPVYTGTAIAMNRGNLLQVALVFLHLVSSRFKFLHPRILLFRVFNSTSTSYGISLCLTLRGGQRSNYTTPSHSPSIL